MKLPQKPFPDKLASSIKEAAGQALTTATDIASNAAKVGGKAAHAASEVGGKAAEAASSGLKNAAEKVQQAQHEKRLARLNPLFPEEYNDPDFDLPNMIIVVDEDQRKGIPECAGAIGWITKDADMEVLNLYHEAIPESGLSFFPPASIGSIYYRDTFNGKHFIKLSDFSSTVQKDKMTELRDIAYYLGAVECRLESYESERTAHSKKRAGSAKTRLPIAGGLGASASTKQANSERTSTERSVRFEQTFDGSREPVAPELKYFEHDREILSLINMVLSGNAPKEYTIQLGSSASCSMSMQLASKIDGTLKKVKASASFSMEDKVSSEARQMLDFYIKFKD